MEVRIGDESRRNPYAYMRTLAMKCLTKISIPIALAWIAITTLAGCSATVDTRWATSEDTLNHWETLAPNLPVEVRGQLPNASNEQIAQAIPNAVPEQSSASKGGTDPVAASIPRFVVEVGRKIPSADSAYCAESSPEQTSISNAPPLTLTLTLCDGSRLVGRSSTLIHSGNAVAGDISHQVRHLKNLTLIDIAKGDPKIVETED
jgi:hypothetical protein